jgi:hypothetical protein
LGTVYICCCCPVYGGDALACAREKYATVPDSPATCPCPCHAPEAAEGASELERLRAENRQLRERLDRWRVEIDEAVRSIRWGGVTAPITRLEKLLGEA